MEQAVIARRTTIGRLYRVCDRLGRQGRSGIGALRLALDDWLLGDCPPDSVLEPMMARLLRRHGLPAPEFQYEIRVDGRFIARVDFAWPSAWLLTEVDGLHSRTSAARHEHDLARQNDLVLLGYRILRFPWGAVVCRPDYVARQVAAELTRGG